MVRYCWMVFMCKYYMYSTEDVEIKYNIVSWFNEFHGGNFRNKDPTFS